VNLTSKPIQSKRGAATAASADEAHRFAVSFHRQQRSDKLRRSPVKFGLVAGDSHATPAAAD